MSAAPARLRCVVDSMNYSACGHLPGDSFEVGPDGLRLGQDSGFCFFAVNAVLPVLLQRLGSADIEEWLASRPVVMCPDPPEALRMRVEAAPTEEPS